MKAWALALVLSLFVGQLARAAFGDDAKALDTRYGTPTKTWQLFDDCECRDYRVGGMVLNVILWNGVSHSEEWARPGERASLSESEVYPLLDANKNGSQWELRDYSERRKSWKRASDNASPSTTC